MAVRRPSSTRAPWIATRGEAAKLREKPGVERTGGAARERRVAAKRRAAGSSARPGRNRGGERRERELIDSNSNFCSNISFKTWKTLNTKVVENLKIYNFYFMKKFNRAKV